MEVLHIVLMVLKIIGFLAIGLIGLLLGVLILSLLVPVRYRIQGSYYHEFIGNAKITWLLHMVSVRISYDKEVKMRIRILGIPLFRPKKEPAAKAEKEIFDDVKTVVSKAEEKAEEEIESQPIPEKPVKEVKVNSAKCQIPSKRRWFKRIWDKICRIWKQLKNVTADIEKTKKWIQDSENQAVIQLVFRQFKKLMHHILPQKIKGSITFGFEDPYNTGQVLTYAGLLYPLYQDKLILIPVFDRVVLEGEIGIKGRIRLGTCLMAAFHIYRNKRFRVLLKRWLG